MIRKPPNYIGCPCDGCPDVEGCEDPQSPVRTISADTVERGCVRFINWLKRPMSNGRNI